MIGRFSPPRMPIEKRMERLKNHFAGIEHFGGPEYPAPKFDFTNAWDVRIAVVLCMKQGLTIGRMVEVLDLPEERINFERDMALQDAE